MKIYDKKIKHCNEFSNECCQHRPDVLIITEDEPRVIVSVDNWTDNPIRPNAIGKLWFNPLIQKLFECVKENEVLVWEEQPLEYGVFYVKPEDSRPFVYDGRTLAPIANEPNVPSFYTAYPDTPDRQQTYSHVQIGGRMVRSSFFFDRVSLSIPTTDPIAQIDLQAGNVHKIGSFSRVCEASLSTIGTPSTTLPLITIVDNGKINVYLTQPVPPQVTVNPQQNVVVNLVWNGTIAQ